MDFGAVFTKEFLLNWRGRLNRAQYWAFAIMYIGVAVVLSLVEGLIGTGGILGGLFGLAMLYPAICIGIRRWHDRDKSGWWTLIALLPIIGFLWVFIECGCLKGSEGENRFGPDPLATSA